MKWTDLKGTIRKGGPQTRDYVLVRRKPYRNWLLHRAVVDLLIKEWNPFGWTGIPDGWEVHHIDFVKHHCCPKNLLLLAPEIHHFLQKSHSRDPYTGQYIKVRSQECMSDEYLDQITGKAV